MGCVHHSSTGSLEKVVLRKSLLCNKIISWAIIEFCNLLFKRYSVNSEKDTKERKDQTLVETNSKLRFCFWQYLLNLNSDHKYWFLIMNEKYFPTIMIIDFCRLLYNRNAKKIVLLPRTGDIILTSIEFAAE